MKIEKITNGKELTIKVEYTLDEAKLKFPEWYEKVIVKGQRSKGCWTVNRALYDWWKKKIPEVSGGHRYYYLMVLVIYGIKCGIPKKEVKKDLYDLFEVVKKVEHSHELTEYDIESALEVAEGQNCKLLSVANLEKGIYLVRATNDGETISESVVIK